MKKFLILIPLLFLIGCSASRCNSGNCVNGYGSTSVFDEGKVLIYTGEFKNSTMHGKGTLTFDEGKYEGEFKNGKMYGYGKIINANEEVIYEGELRNNLRHGQGTDNFTNGNKYVGEFRVDLKYGYGTYTWTNGDKYEGYWGADFIKKEDFQEGQGTYTYADGTIKKGFWKNGNYVGVTEVKDKTNDKSKTTNTNSSSANNVASEIETLKNSSNTSSSNKTAKKSNSISTTSSSKSSKCSGKNSDKSWVFKGLTGYFSKKDACLKIAAYSDDKLCRLIKENKEDALNSASNWYQDEISSRGMVCSYGVASDKSVTYDPDEKSSYYDRTRRDVEWCVNKKRTDYYHCGKERGTHTMKGAKNVVEQTIRENERRENDFKEQRIIKQFKDSIREPLKVPGSKGFN